MCCYFAACNWISLLARSTSASSGTLTYPSSSLVLRPSTHRNKLNLRSNFAHTMSDEASSPVKRGRKQVNAEKSQEKVESKKRQRKEVKQAESGDEDDATAPKRGRGRPKGSTKRRSPIKSKAKSVSGRRGRPKKDEKSNDSGDEDNEENDAGEDEDD